MRFMPDRQLCLPLSARQGRRSGCPWPTCLPNEETLRTERVYFDMLGTNGCTEPSVVGSQLGATNSRSQSASLDDQLEESVREVQATVVKARLSELLRDVERGESITITRYGKKVAVLVPTEDDERERRRQAMDRFMEMRSKWKPAGISVEEFMDWRHEGHRY